MVVAGLAIVTAQASGSTAPASTVALVKVQGIVDPALTDDVKGTVRRAEQEGATVVLQLDSRGAYGDQAADLAAFQIGRASCRERV